MPLTRWLICWIVDSTWYEVMGNPAARYAGYIIRDFWFSRQPTVSATFDRRHIFTTEVTAFE
ncbi:hypothetical protein [Fimbriiglobus ruber]|uniref:hypothetical protein n=1 Tax=Fimbriiglobus ruber TaxID=1908690 RepID=UPI00137A1151|nr:hypothetical protein [Fimbriiglobus ruber]